MILIQSDRWEASEQWFWALGRLMLFILAPTNSRRKSSLNWSSTTTSIIVSRSCHRRSYVINETFLNSNECNICYLDTRRNFKSNWGDQTAIANVQFTLQVSRWMCEARVPARRHFGVLPIIHDAACDESALPSHTLLNVWILSRDGKIVYKLPCLRFGWREFLLILQLNKERNYSPKVHVIAGGAAGAVAAAFTTPLDVCKTLLNTQEGGIGSTRGLNDAIKKVYRVAGMKGFFKGLQARVLYQMPATAVCWSTYEFFKYLLNRTEKVKPVVSSTPTKELSLSFDDNKSSKQPLHFVLPKDSPKILSEIPSTSIHPTNPPPTLPYPRELPAMSNGIVYAHTMHDNHRQNHVHLTDFRSSS